MPSVFISYSHDSPEHSERVLQLSNRLREHGIDANIDQYDSWPKEGWAVWMEKQIEAADFVLMVCTEAYSQRVRGEAPPGVGRGVAWEGAIIRAENYQSVYANEKFIPVFFDAAVEDFLLLTLRSGTYHTISTLDLDGTGYEELYRRLTSQPTVSRPPLGDQVDLPSDQPAISASLPTRPTRTDEWELPAAAPWQETPFPRSKLPRTGDYLVGRTKEKASLEQLQDQHRADCRSGRGREDSAGQEVAGESAGQGRSWRSGTSL